MAAVAILKNCHISAAIQPILTQFGMMMHFEPLDRPDCQKFEILQIHAAILKIVQWPYLSRGLSDFDKIWYDGAVQPF